MQTPSTFAHEALQQELARYLKGKRLAHSHNVAAFAELLADLHAPELSEQAWVAGLLHDSAKPLRLEETWAAVKRFEIPVSAIERAAPYLLHGKVGAALLPERFAVNNVEIAAAIEDHVTGRLGMGMLSKLLYVADQSAADRDFEAVEQLRSLSVTDLDAAVLLVAQNKISSSLRKGLLLEPATVDLYNYMMLEGSVGAH